MYKGKALMLCGKLFRLPPSRSEAEGKEVRAWKITIYWHLGRLVPEDSD